MSPLAPGSTPRTPLAETILAKPHPLRRTFRTLFALGILGICYTVWAAVALGGLAASGDLATIANLALGLGGGLFFAIYAARALRLLPGIQLANAALNEILAGRYESAEALLRRAESTSSVLGIAPRTPAAIRRIIALHRAAIAFGRGDMARTIAHTNDALAVSESPWDRAGRRTAALRALAMRAMARALSDDWEGARADIVRARALVEEGNLGAGVLAGEGVLTDPTARLDVAEAVLLARAGESEKLRALLESKRATLFEHASPRERALLRGLARRLAAKTQSPYRTPPKGAAPGGDEPDVEDWIERVLPEVAPFVPKTERAVPRTDADEAPRARAATRVPDLPLRGPGASPWRTRVVLAAFVAATTALYLMLGEGRGATGVPGQGSHAAGVLEELPALMLFAIAWAIALAYARLAQGRRRLLSGYRALAHGDLGEAERALRELPPSSHAIYRALAALSLARLAARAGRPDEALAESERGLSTIVRGRVKASASDVVGPELVTERAVAMASLGRGDEALALAETLPIGFAFRERSLFRIRLFVLATSGRFEEAARLAASRPGTLPIDPRTELVADVARSTVAPESVGIVELTRVRADASDPEARTFLSRTVPDLLAAFERSEALRDATSDDDAAEVEHRALDEFASLTSDEPRARRSTGDG